MNVRILSSAYRDLEKGRRFYARHGEDVGRYFLSSLFADIDSLVLYAGIHRRVFGFHGLLAKRFPFAVYYQFNHEKNVVVYRVLDCRRDPERIQAALTRSAK